MKSTEALYLQDLGLALKERALEALVQAKSDRANGASEFHIGRSAAFYEVISLMLSHADSFGIPARSLSLEGVDPERDLIG